LGLADSLWAADPIIGKWKLNIAKSTFQEGDTIPKESTETYREVNGQIERTWTYIEADGSLELGDPLTWPREGGVVKAPAGLLPKGLSYVQTLIEPAEWVVTVLQDGRQVSVMHKITSKDGKTLRITGKGIDDKGKSFETLGWFDRQ